MKRYHLPVLLILFSIQTFTTHAQMPPQGERRKAIREEKMQQLAAAKWAFIIYRLNLEEARSNQLLPVFKAYETEKRDIMMSSGRPKIKNGEIADDEQAEAIMNARLENAQKLLDLKEKYKPRFLAILSPRELLMLQNAEQDFAVKVMMERQKRKMEKNAK